MKVASVQLEIRDQETKEERIERVDKWLESNLADNDLILLPEIWATGYFSFDRYLEEAESIDGPFVQRFSAKAEQLKTHLFAGSFVEKEGDRYYNTSLLFDPDGKLIGTNRKVHLFRYGSAEGELLTAGEQATMFWKQALARWVFPLAMTCVSRSFSVNRWIRERSCCW